MIKVGDYVEIISSINLKCDLKGLIGEVVSIKEDECGLFYGVNFNKDIGGHHLDGKVNYGYGYYIYGFSIKLVNKKKTPCISIKLMKLLKEWNPNIEDYLIYNEGFNYFDIAINDPKKISYIKNDRIDRFNGNFWNYELREKLATMSKPSRIIKCIIDSNKIKLSTRDMEELLAIFERNNDTYELIEVTGEDIRKYYYHETYETKSGSLNSSCMRWDECQKYFDIYVDNCKMLIKRNINTGLISGRAIIWDIEFQLHNDDKIVIKKFMDRIYGDDITIAQFKYYAKDNDYIYKVNQSCDDNDIIYKKNTIEDDEFYMKVIKNNKIYNYYPYMDTMAKLYEDGSIYNHHDGLEDNEYKYLQETDGNEIISCKKCGKHHIFESNCINIQDYGYVCCEHIDDYVAIKSSWDEYYYFLHTDKTLYHCSKCGKIHNSHFSDKYDYKNKPICENCRKKYFTMINGELYDKKNDNIYYCKKCDEYHLKSYECRKINSESLIYDLNKVMGDSSIQYKKLRRFNLKKYYNEYEKIFSTEWE